MPRIGQNPMRTSAAVSEIKETVLAVVTHLPDDGSEYHSNRFEVVSTCLETMRSRANKEHTFMVWDNSSSDLFRNYLANEFKPDILILSSNIGKTAARASMIQMVPLGALFCYSDDDMYFEENWLKPQIDLLNHFRGASVVSGYPCRVMFRWATQTAINYGNKHGKVETGRFIPEEWEKDYAESIGREWEKHIEITANDVDVRIKSNGKEAYATSHHCQFIGYAVNLVQAVRYDKMAMGDERIFDETLNKIGPRLSTTERLCRHMGNKMPEGLKV